MAKSDPQGEPPEQPDPAALTKTVRQALARRVDFRALEEFHAEAYEAFQGKSYKSALRSARNSLPEVEEAVRRYVEGSWAFAVAASFRILETSRSSSEVAQRAHALLRNAIESMEDGTFQEDRELLQKLTEVVLDLYDEEMEGYRQYVAQQGRALAEIQSMGGDASDAEAALQRAVIALAEDDREGYLEAMTETDAHLEKAREGRVREIERSLTGAPPRIREAAEKAMAEDDYISAHLLLSPTQRGFPHPVRASREERRASLVREIIEKIRPLVAEAAALGVDTTQAETNVREAIQLLEEGRFAGALRRARRAYQTVKAYPEGPEPVPAEPLPPPPGEEADSEPEEEEDGLDRAMEKELEVALEEAEANHQEEVDRLLADLEAEGTDEARPQLRDVPLLWCFNCGSLNVTVDDEGTFKCMDCQAEVPMDGDS